MEAIQKFGTNVASFHLATGERRWYIIGCYLYPDVASTIDCVVAALREFPQGLELLVAGYFNAYLEQTEGERREEEILAALAEARLEDMQVHFLL